MQYKWASPKTNPAARYFPQTFSKEEEALLYRCLSIAATMTERRATASGPIQTKGSKRIYVSPEQEAIFKALQCDSNDVNGEIHSAVERVRDRKPIRARKWLVKQMKDKGFDLSKFDDWCQKTMKQSLDERLAAVKTLNADFISKTNYGKPVQSGTAGFFGRDAQNPWGRATGSKNPKERVLRDHHLQKVLPLIRRIDEAFRLAVPERYEAQKRFCQRLDPRFVIEGTCFTTITVNKNFRTYAHRDAGDLSQGLSNLAVFSNGREFKGGHLVLPEFNVEFALKPRDLLFIANHEYIHENTPIEAVDPDSERISIVCYAREDLAFCGTVEYEDRRRSFKLACGKKFKGMWESPQWYNYLMRELGYPTATLIEKARRHNFLNPEILTLSEKFGGLPWSNSAKWEYVDTVAVPSYKQRQALRALMSAIHFKTPRQDKWSGEDGPVAVDALYLNEEGWAVAYCESQSGAVKLPNNRFNVQAVGHLPFVPKSIRRLSRNLCAWLEDRWSAGETVKLVRWETGVQEAPFRMALTTIREGTSATDISKLTEGTTQEAFYESAAGIADRSTWNRAPRTGFFYDLGWSRRSMRKAVLSTEGEAICDAIQLRENYEVDFLNQEVSHWMKRAKNIGSDEFKSRYERIGTYSMPKKVDMPLAGKPWAVEAKPEEFCIVQKQYRKSAEKRTSAGKGATTKLKWSSTFQALPILGSTVGSDATLIVWRFKDNVGGGQMVATNGANYWLFQAIGSNKPITRRIRTDSKPVKVSEPTTVGHLQRSQIVLAPDKSNLVEGLRARAEFVPTPFSEMSSAKLAGYQSEYRQGRANILAVAGEQATGKSFVLRQLIAKSKDWRPGKFGKVLYYTHSKALNLYILGVYSEGELFPGTDRLTKTPYEDAESFIIEMAPQPVNIVFEGERLLVARILKVALDQKTNLAILRLRVSEALKKQRHIDRKDTQKEKSIKSITTKVENICQSPMFWDCVEEVRNESKEDSARIFKMMNWFLSERTKKMVA